MNYLCLTEKEHLCEMILYLLFGVIFELGLICGGHGEFAQGDLFHDDLTEIGGFYLDVSSHQEQGTLEICIPD